MGIVREISLLLLMAGVTVLVVAFESGHIHMGFKVACFAAPLKYLVATVHHRLFARIADARN